MNIWAFLFYTYLIHSFSALVGRKHEQNETGEGMVALVLMFIVIFFFIYMSWYQ